jgi:hypothetical protein
MKHEAELRRELFELEDTLEILTRRLALIGDHLRFSGGVADPNALAAARDDAVLRMDRLMTRMRAVEGQLLQAGLAARSGTGAVRAVPANL